MGAQRTWDFVTKKILGIDVEERYTNIPNGLDQRARSVLDPAEVYLEDEPSVSEWFKELAPTPADALHYVTSLFPSSSWVRRYNFRWLAGDVVAGTRADILTQSYGILIDFGPGITIGLVVVPQALAYASLAGLEPPYGLYTSFTGAVLYWVFGTSKDIVIGVSVHFATFWRDV